MSQNRKIWKDFRYIFLTVVIICLLYAVFAMPLYVMQKKCVMKRLYTDISDMDLTDFDDEDEDDIEEYQEERFEILIVDEKGESIYGSRRYQPEHYIEKTFRNHIDEYLDEPRILSKERESRYDLIMRVKLIQREQNYYVFIKKEVLSGYELIQETILYFMICMTVLLIILWSILLRRVKEEESRNRKSDFILEKNQKEFVGNITHELKTPLAVISSQVEMLQLMGDKIDKEYYFSSIQEELGKMSQMIGDLLDVTMLDNQLSTIKMGKVNLTDMVDYLLMRYDSLFQKKQITVIRDVEQGCITWGSKVYLERAVNNYMMNAFQHTEQGKEISIRMKRSGSVITLEVYNEGEQIKEDQMDQIWNSFYTTKIENGREVEKNVGLGLYMVKKIVEKHNGTCGVRNEERGVTFIAEFPQSK